jgi:hypothetical protein
METTTLTRTERTAISLMTKIVEERDVDIEKTCRRSYALQRHTDATLAVVCAVVFDGDNHEMAGHFDSMNTGLMTRCWSLAV